MSNPIDRNANTHKRHQTNWQRLANIHTIVGENASGTVNGVNTVFTVAHPINLNTDAVYVAGSRKKRTTDYTVSASGLTITFAVAPAAGPILVDYVYG